MTEQRKHTRISESLMISHRLLLKGAYKTGARSSDISEGGISFPAHRSIEPGTNLELEIYIAEYKEPIVAISEVVWLRKRNDIRYPFLVGVKFIKIELLDRQKLRTYIRKISEGGTSTDVRWLG